jgi:hypothetical protein
MPTDADRPLDLLPVREAARLVDRGVSTLRGWVRAGELRGWHADPAHPENTPLLVSRAEVLALVVTTGRASNPGRRSRAESTPPSTPSTDTPEHALDRPEHALDLARLRSTVAELRADVRVALAERDGARAALEATVREVAAVAGRCSTLEVLADAERRHALDLADRLAAAEAERDALREHQGLPWWRRLLAPPSTSPKRLPGGDGEA